MKKKLYELWAKFLTAFGNIRISKYIPWLYYDSTDFKVLGKNIEDISKILQPGDVILRGYDSYLDGKFIDDPLDFSHGAIYIGNNEIIHAIAEGVSRINVIDFCQCDRIAIFRAKSGSRKAVKIAKSYEDYEYDFLFDYGDNAIYCFELCALSYPDLKIERCQVTKLLFFHKEVYLAKSFFDSKDFTCIYHYNPKYGIDFIK